MKKFYSLVVLFLLLVQTLQAQEKITLNGSVQNKNSGEELLGAVIKIVELPQALATSNEYGFYSLTIPPGTYTVKIKYSGFEEMTQTINATKDEQINFQLQKASEGQELETVVVSSKKANLNVTQAEMGVQKIDIAEIAKLPVLFGEKDILKTIQLLPGVKSAGEGNSGFYVRGGSADQNLILLDEANVYNASHLLGFFSTFNSDAIKDALLIKGNTPAQYGGRLASVLDIKMNEGNDKNYKVSGGIGLISSRLMVEGPIQKDKSSFMITGRRTYADLFLALSSDPAVSNNTLYFYDLNAKANYRINDKNRIFLSGYFGRDVLGFGSTVGIDWGNVTGTLRWNRIINKRLFSNTSLIYTKYNYDLRIKPNDTIDFSISSLIRDWSLKQDFQYTLNSKFTLRFGFNSIYHTITPKRLTTTTSTVVSPAKQERYAWDNAFYISNTAKLHDQFVVDYGVRLSTYTILGTGTYQTYDKGKSTDTISLSNNAFGKTYVNVEPRIATTFILNEAMSIKAAYSRNTQSLHLLSNSTSTNPTDQWTGNTYNIRPGIADQISAGWFQNFNDNAYEMSIETYYKWMANEVDYKDGADLNNAPDVESELLFGKGRAYGIEFFLKKKTGKFTGWIGYTLSRTERLIEGVNNNNWYPVKQDRTHDLSVVAMYQISKKWSISSVFVFYTGNAVTFPSGKYQIGSRTFFYYTERNGYRMPNYHRLDFSATYEFEKGKRFEHSLNFGVYNVYARENAYTINFVTDPKDPTRTVAEQTSLFRYVPSITYNFKF